MRLFNLSAICAGALALAAFLVPTSGNAVTVSSFGPSSGACVAANCDLAFVVPDDYEVFINHDFTSADNGAAFEFVYEFVHTTGGGAFNFNTVNLPTEFTNLVFEWTGPGLALSLLGNTNPVTTTLHLLAGELYTLTITGAANIRTGGFANIDVSLTAVPVPPAALLFGSALVGMGFLSRKRKKALS